MTNLLFVTFVCLLICLHNVICTEPDKNKDVQSIRETYRYNHPPGAEEYESIPVVIVYEDQDERVGKSIRNNSEIFNGISDKSFVATTTESYTIFTTDVMEIFSKGETESPISKSTIDEPTESTLKKSSTRTSIDKYQIPVAIVYDEISQVNHTEVRKIKNKRVKLRRRKQQVRKNEGSNASDANRKKLEYKSSSDLRSTKFAINPNVKKSYKEVNVNEHVKIGALPVDPVNVKTTQYLRKGNPKPLMPQFKNRVNGEHDPVVPIIMSENYVFAHSGNFNYRYESGDGTTAFETGILKSIDGDKTGEAVVGSFSYKDEDGKDISLSYTADENGYRPVGAHLPTPPPIPPAIARALKYLATKTTPEPVTESNRKTV